MITGFPLTRPLLILLLAIYFLTIFLHSAELPPWMFAFFIFIGLWRINILREKWQQPRPLMKVLLAVLSVLLVLLEYRQLFSIEPMLSLLLFALSLKIMEIRYQRDYVLILFLSCFVVACSFLFEQSILHSILGLAVIALIVVALLQVYNHYQQEVFSWRQSFSIVAKMLLQSTLLMFVLMLVIPRVNPLWSVPLRSGTGITGISDSMSPGDFDQLIRSNELAFRVSYREPYKNSSESNANPLSASQLYWRGLVLDQFDGRRWQRSLPVNTVINSSQNTPRFNLTEKDEGLSYEVLLEPTGQHWLFGIPSVVVNNINVPLVYSSSNEVFAKERIDQHTKYLATTYKRNVHNAAKHSMTLSEYRRLTSLPQGFNPQARQQAKRWYQQAANPQEYIKTVLDFYRSRFVYTLSPPKLGQHSVDEFLFQSQQGFCEHYASSFVVLMRSVGIPARVVVGYQGGKWNKDEKFLSVYQRDAHAWAEVWLKESGWLRVDPTAAVSVARIEQGLEAALPENERQQLQAYGRNYLGLQELYNQWQVLNYRWQRWVLSYDAIEQKTFLQRYLGDVTPFKLALLLLAPLILVALGLSLGFLFNRLKPLSREQKIIRRLQGKLQKLGVPFQYGETINSYCSRAEQVLPNHCQRLRELRKLLESIFYNPAAKQNQWRKAEKVISTL